jgi:putative cardiolipin synthase
MHDKLFIIDNRFLIIGGRNIADQYFSYENYTGKNRFIDTEVLVYNTTGAGGSIAESKDYFNRLLDEDCVRKLGAQSANSRNYRRGRSVGLAMIARYEKYKNEELPVDIKNTVYADDTTATNNIKLLTNSTAPEKKESVIAYDLYRLAKLSDEVIIQTPYTVLTKENTGHLRDICKTADVTILTNCSANTDTFWSFSNYMVNRKSYLNTGVKIFEHQPRGYTLHSKVYLFDERLSAVGSFNLDEHSTRLDTESMLVIDSVAFNQEIKDSIQPYFDKSLQVNNRTNKYIEKDGVSASKTSTFTKVLMSVVGFVLNLFRYMI